MDPAPVPGRWFDGASSRARPVLVALQAGPRGPTLTLHPLGPPPIAPLTLGPEQIDWPERWREAPATTPLVVDLREHGSLEIADAGPWHTALAAAGHRPTLAERMQRRWRPLLGVLALAVAALALFFGWGTPWLATQLTRQIPLAWEQRIAQQALQDLDRQWFKPSKLPAARQARLREGFEALAQQTDAAGARYRRYRPQLALLFRDAGMPNALALPGGTIVLTDALVETAAAAGLDDDALLGVLAHEIGHVVHRHGTRMVVEQGVLNAGLGVVLGDVSGLLSIGGSILTGAAYQRSHEREADCFASALMARAGKPTAPMAALLLKLDKDAAARQARPPTPRERMFELLSSHPDTAERALRMQRGVPRGC